YTQASGRIDEIHRLLGDEVPRTKGGSALPVKPWVVRLTQEFKYDSNIINQADGKIIKVSNTGSPQSRSAVYGKYEFIFANWVALTPELSSEYNYFFRRAPEVYSNDNSSTTAALRSRLDHLFKSKPASGLVEYEFNFSTRDYTSMHKQLFS